MCAKNKFLDAEPYNFSKLNTPLHAEQWPADKLCIVYQQVGFLLSSFTVCVYFFHFITKKQHFSVLF
jgi:hypothetical protein